MWARSIRRARYFWFIRTMPSVFKTATDLNDPNVMISVTTGAGEEPRIPVLVTGPAWDGFGVKWLARP
jgi:hypothetical protein